MICGQKQKPLSQLGAGSSTIEQMLEMDLDTLIAMSDAAILEYLRPAIEAVPSITSRNIISKPAQHVKVTSAASAALYAKRDGAKQKNKKPETMSIADRLRAMTKMKTLSDRQKELQNLKDLLGEEEGLAEAERRSTGQAEDLQVRQQQADERRARLQGKPIPQQTQQKPGVTTISL